MSAEELCLRIYAEMVVFYKEISLQPNYGFKILYGPPIINPSILFIGYQPGGNSNVEQNLNEKWSPINEYVTEDWALAKQIRKMFAKIDLEKCVALNAIFMRAPNIREYERFANPDLRKKIQEFCKPRVIQIIKVIKPQRIVVIGLETAGIFGNFERDLQNEKGRTLTKTGKIAVFSAIATLHLSGSRISNFDRKIITERILTF